MTERKDDERLAVLKVLAAAAQEAEELAAATDGVGDAEREALKEADRRLKLFMRASRSR